MKKKGGTIISVLIYIFRGEVINQSNMISSYYLCKVKSTVVSSKTSSTSTSKLKRSRSIGEEEVSVSVKEAKLGKFFFCWTLFFFHNYIFVYFLKHYFIETTSDVFSIFKPQADIQWREFESVMIGQYLTSDIKKIEGRSKIGAFDLVGTKIRLIYVQLSLICSLHKTNRIAL